MKTIEFCAGFACSLTTGLDTGALFTGGAGNDTFNAADIAGAKTWTTGDAINGGGGTNTFNVITAGAITVPVAATVTNIQTANLTSGATIVADTQSHILPVTVAELAKLIPAMPLGFVKTEAIFQLGAITSVQPGANYFVAHDGRWLGEYVPATLRAYPFRLAKPQDREESVLCVDESSGLVVAAGQGEAFFDDAGAPSQVVKDILDLLSKFESSRVTTQAALDALQAAELIQPWALNVKQGEQTMPVEGALPHRRGGTQCAARRCVPEPAQDRRLAPGLRPVVLDEPARHAGQSRRASGADQGPACGQSRESDIGWH